MKPAHPNASAPSLHDRMLAVYRHELPDRAPLSIYSRYLPRGACERLVRNLGLGIIDYYPAVTMLAPPWHMLPGYLTDVKGAELEISYTWEQGELRERRTYHTPVGRVWQETRKDPTYGSDWISRFYIQSVDDYRVMQYLVENTVLLSNEAALQARITDLGDDGVVLGRMDRCPYQKLLIELAGPERFLLDLHESPAPVLELMAAMECRMDEAFRMALGSSAEVIWQPDNITADMIPPQKFRNFCQPFYGKHGRECREAAKPYLVHIDGRTRALKELIARSPIDGVESFSLPMMGGDMSYSEAHAAWPDKLILPNFPSSLCLETDDAIRHFLDALLGEIPAGEPFMLQISEDFPPDQWQRVLPVLVEYLA
jgi:hypothetical protein